MTFVSARAGFRTHASRGCPLARGSPRVPGVCVCVCVCVLACVSVRAGVAVRVGVGVRVRFWHTYFVPVGSEPEVHQHVRPVRIKARVRG